MLNSLCGGEFESDMNLLHSNIRKKIHPARPDPRDLRTSDVERFTNPVTHSESI